MLCNIQFHPIGKRINSENLIPFQKNLCFISKHKTLLILRKSSNEFCERKVMCREAVNFLDSNWYK